MTINYPVQEKHIIIETENKRHKLHIDEYARWMSLLEAVQYIDNKAEQKNLDLDHYDWIKPLTFQKYIEQRQESIKEEIEKIEAGNFIYSVPDPRINSALKAQFSDGIEQTPTVTHIEVEVPYP